MTEIEDRDPNGKVDSKGSINPKEGQQNFRILLANTTTLSEASSYRTTSLPVGIATPDGTQ